LSIYDIQSTAEDEFYVKFVLGNKYVGIYDKDAFLIELAHTCSHETLPFIIGGDFNILKYPEDKRKHEFHPPNGQIFLIWT
jgi:hypothetical protein